METAVETRTGLGIARLKEESYKFFANLSLGKEGWEDTGFFSKIDFDEDRGERRDRKGYVDLLPKIGGKNIEQIIDELITENGGRRIKLLDVGSWMGYPLLDCQQAEKWKGKLETMGVTAGIADGQRRFLKRYGIKTVIGDAHNLTTLLNGEKFDLIVSNKTVGYMADSALALEQIWDCLEKRGIALIAGFLWPADKLKEVGRLNGLLKKSGKKVNFTIMPEWFEKTNYETGKKYRHLQVTEIKNTDGKLVLPLLRESVEKFDPEYPAVVFYEVEKTFPSFKFSTHFFNVSR